MEDESRIKRKLVRGGQLAYLGLRSLKKDGVRNTADKVLRVMGFGRAMAYRRWAKEPLYTEPQLEAQRKHVFEKNILFSIITPLYNTRKDFLHEMLDSVIAQTYPQWELCLADGSDSEHSYVGRIIREYADRDPRIRYKKLDVNMGIAGNTNAAMEMAEGDFISLLDHDDVLHPAALFETMRAVCESGADFVYTDEMTFLGRDIRKIMSINFKKDYAPDDLLANNYICHFTSFRRDLIEKSGGAFREGFDGSQDHELFLRLTDAAQKIEHVQKPLYYWRATAGSTAASAAYKPYVTQAGIKAVKGFLAARGIEAEVCSAKDLPSVYRVSYPLPSPEPLVSIVIANCDHAEDLRNCVDSITQKTTYGNYEIIIVENNSKDHSVFELYEALSEEQDKVRVVTWPGKGFNWPAINNYGIREAAKGEYILLLNNDTEVITPEWIEEMLMHAQRPEVGAVGAMLYYPNDTIQHAGVIIGLRGVAGHASSRERRGETGYMARLCYAQDLSAVTGACMMMRRSVFDEAGGIDEELAVGLNDVDFCLRLRKDGYRIVWTPYAELYHFESKSRGAYYGNRIDRERNEAETALFTERWAEILERGDPYFNPNLSLVKSNYEPVIPDRTKMIEKKGRYDYYPEDHTFAVCAYKESPYLEECLESLMRQSVRGKVIVCTSTPNDSIFSAAERFGVPVFVNERAGGMGADWNFAYGCADTKLVTLAHQDDIYEPQFLEETLDRLNRASSPAIALTCCYEIQNGRKVTHRDFVNLRIKRWLLAPLSVKGLRSVGLIKRASVAVANPVCCPSVTYVKSSLPRQLFDETMLYSVDWEAWIRLSRGKGSFVYIPQMLVGHRIYTGSSTMTMIDNGQREIEDRRILRELWPEPVASLIYRLYSRSVKNRREKNC